MATATDNFNRADNTDLGTAWDVIYNTGHQIISNQCACNTGAPNYDGAELNNTISPGSAQYSQATVAGAVGSGGATGVAIYMSAASGGNFYGIYCDSFNKYLFVVSAGGFTTHASSSTNLFADTDTIRIEVSSGVVRPMKNGSTDPQLGTWADTTLTSGAVGVCGYGVGLGSNLLDDWEGGDLGGAAGHPNYAYAQQ